MGLFKLAAFAGLGYAGARWLMSNRSERNAAYSDDQPQQGHTSVRDSGPKAMRDTPQREWSEVDEASDQSFPASDPPSTY